MRPDEFDEASYLLPEALRLRAEALRPHLLRVQCNRCREVTDAIALALMAARYDDLDATERLVETAEYSARVDDHGGATGCVVGGHRRRITGNRGQVIRWSGRTAGLVAATDASWKQRAAGIAYVVSDGRFGLRGWLKDRLDPSGPSRVLIHELRAVEFLLSGFIEPPDRLTVLVDNTTALSYLHRWQNGETIMPAGYSLRPRSRAAQPTLVRLAQRLPDLPWVSFQHVHGHTGHLLNEAADALSHMARRRVREVFEVDSRAYGLVDAFLLDWHTAGTATRA